MESDGAESGYVALRMRESLCLLSGWEGARAGRVALVVSRSTECWVLHGSHTKVNTNKGKIKRKWLFNPFPADVAIKRHLGSAPKSHFCDLTGKTEVIGLSDLMTLLLTWGIYIGNRRIEHSMFKKKINWLKIDLVDQKLFKIQLTKMWELVTRRWNAWHWEKHCIFTAGGERVKEKKGNKLWTFLTKMFICRSNKGDKLTGFIVASHCLSWGY
jgi:hypothetical protein